MKFLSILCLFHLALGKDASVSQSHLILKPQVISPRELDSANPNFNSTVKPFVITPREAESRNALQNIGCNVRKVLGAGAAFVISSPRYPKIYGAYRNNQYCNRHFEVQPNVEVVISCRYFNIRTSRSGGCRDMFSLKINGKTALSTCGTRLHNRDIVGFPVTSSPYTLSANFFISGYSWGRGFICNILGEDASTEPSTVAPTEAPTDAPTDAPTEGPTETPTGAPTDAPTGAPTNPSTDSPTDSPTEDPSTDSPTDSPTDSSTDGPTEAPTTANPLSSSPTSATPTTSAPTAAAPTTSAPTTSAPTCDCGTSSTAADRIVGGGFAKPNEHPWQVGLLSSSNTPSCGGTLISSCHILTAAHCVEGIPENAYIYVRLGDHDTRVTEEGQRTLLAKVKTHEKYNRPIRLNNDFALLTLRSQDCIKTFSDQIRPACLPPVGDNFARKTATVSGWGTTRSGGPHPRVLKDTDLTVLTNNQCKRAYGNSITNEMLCASGPGTDSCQGDSGGPLTTKVGDRSYLIGVVSFGAGCADPGYPGVYARTTSVLQWLEDNGVKACRP